MNPKTEIVGVARGFYALPILMTLARRGVVDRLLGDGVTLGELGGHRDNLRSVMTYLANLGWVVDDAGRYRATELGTKVLRRCGAYGILYSYRSYIANLEQILFDPEAKVHVHRDENVVGSGTAHIRKYFSRVKKAIVETEAKYILDVGCGDGTFLNYCARQRSELRLVGVDTSEVALAVTRRNLRSKATLLQGSVSEPEIIVQKLESRGISPAELMVSIWFVFHEVLGIEGVDLTRMLEGYRKLAPNHGMIIGEIFDVPSAVLAAHHDETAVPEFNLFHELSGQKLFTLDAWRESIAAAGFDVEQFIGFDELPGEERTYYGSAIWCLR
ncbi:MAG: class I SAM-dependent methyltransferase [Myxococcota bacterium]